MLSIVDVIDLYNITFWPSYHSYILHVWYIGLVVRALDYHASDCWFKCMSGLQFLVFHHYTHL